MTDILNRPIWHALTTRQKSFAEGGTAAKRFLTSVSPFIATVDDAASSPEDLRDLIPEDGISVLLQATPCPPIEGTEIAMAADGIQMVAAKIFAPEDEADIIDLTEADAPDMQALAALTKPGPFLPRTHELGRFIGVRENGALVAMAGERMRLDGYTEISAVCTHPDFRGRGLAGRLMRIVAARICAAGETPFLHAFANNENAIRLYENLGFELRSKMFVRALRRNV
jgi:ribosomal protein S18 acetylase RimI-like enzyme